MKQAGFGIIELPKNNYKPEAHAMNKSITQSTQYVYESAYRKKHT